MLIRDDAVPAWSLHKDGSFTASVCQNGVYCAVPDSPKRRSHTQALDDAKRFIRLKRFQSTQRRPCWLELLLNALSWKRAP